MSQKGGPHLRYRQRVSRCSRVILPALVVNLNPFPHLETDFNILRVRKPEENYVTAWGGGVSKVDVIERQQPRAHFRRHTLKEV